MFANNSKTRLNNIAVPTIFDVLNPSLQIGIKRRIIFRQETPKSGNLNSSLPLCKNHGMQSNSCTVFR
jgi:hypothetical protein